MMVTKEQFLALKNALRSEVVQINGVGDFTIREWSGLERDRFEQLVMQSTKGGSTSMEHMRARIVCLSVIDENGDLMFSMDDVPEVSKQPAIVLSRIADRAMALNGLTNTDLETAKGN